MAPSRWARRRGSAHRVRWAAALARSDLRTRSTNSVSVASCRGYGIGVHNAGIAPAPLSPETTFCLAPTACQPRRSLMLRAGRVHRGRREISQVRRRHRFPAIVASLACKRKQASAHDPDRGSSAPRAVSNARYVSSSRSCSCRTGPRARAARGSPRRWRTSRRRTDKSSRRLKLNATHAREEGQCAPGAATRPLLYILFRNSAIAVAIAGAELLAGVHLKGLYSTDSGLKLLET